MAGQGAALATALPVLLFRREEIADRLGVVGAVVGEAALIGAAAVVAAVVVPRLRSMLPAGIMLTLAGLLASAGLAMMARTTGIAVFTAGGIMLAVGAAPGLVMHRILLATDARQADRFRTLSWYWAAVAAGVCWPLAARVLAPVTYGTVLWVGAALAAGERSAHRSPRPGPRQRPRGAGHRRPHGCAVGPPVLRSRSGSGGGGGRRCRRGPVAAAGRMAAQPGPERGGAGRPVPGRPP